MTAIIVAYDQNRIIGHKGDIPWHLPEDLKLFKKRTVGHPIIMGRKTWDSLPKKPLADRYNIIVTRSNLSDSIGRYDKGEFKSGMNYVNSIAQAIRLANKMMPNREAFIIGGSQIYLEALKMGVVDKVIASEVDGEHEGDASFPDLKGTWKPVWKDEDHDGFSVVEYVKK